MTLKEGDWFILRGKIFKILASGMYATAVRQMIKTGDDYVEGVIYMMDSDIIRVNAKKYKPYEEELNYVTNKKQSNLVQNKKTYRQIFC